MKTVKPYKLKHKTKILKIFLSFPSLFPPTEIDILKKDLSQKSSPSHKKYVLESNKAVIGFFSIKKAEDSDRSWFIHWLAIDKTYHRQGVGFIAVKHALKQIKQMGCSQAYVETCSCSGEMPARSLYEKAGFKKIAKLPAYYAKNHSKIIYLAKIK